MGLARPQQVSRHLQAIYAYHRPWPGTRIHDVPKWARTVSWALLCVCPHRGGCPRPPPAEPAAECAGTMLGSSLSAGTLGAHTRTVSTTAARSSCEHCITSHVCSLPDHAGTGLRRAAPFCTADYKIYLHFAGRSYATSSRQMRVPVLLLAGHVADPACLFERHLTSHSTRR